MRINTEENMVKAILAKRKSGLSWPEMARKSRERTKTDRESSPSASRVAGA